MKRIISGFLTAFTTLSRLPVPFRFQADFSLFGFFAPFIGVLASLPLFAVSFLSPHTHMVFLLAIFGLFIQYWVFNLFHFDGLLDSADGYLFQGKRERRLEIMKDSTIGSYALFVGTLYIIAKVFLVTELLKSSIGLPVAIRLLLFTLSPVVGRLASSIMPIVLKPARKSGLGAMLTPYKIWPALLITIVVIAGYLSPSWLSSIEVTWGPIAFRSLCAFLFTIIIMSTISARRIGGFTGDTLGATIEFGELACLAAVVSSLP